MFEKLKSVAEKAQDYLSSEDVQNATKWVKSTATNTGTEAVRLAKEAAQSDTTRGVIQYAKNAVKSDMAKDAAAGAAIGAVVTIPVPIIGPVIGATFGAGVGIYKNLTKHEPSITVVSKDVSHEKDLYTELLHLDELKQKNILTEAEFEEQKKKLLCSGN
jgi:hypothetical protein